MTNSVGSMPISGPASGSSSARVDFTDDLRLAGFYGELDVKALAVPAALPDPCSVDPVVWAAAIPLHIQGYDNGTGIPLCIPAARKADTDVIVVRRAATCEAGVLGCPPTQNSLPFVQASKCITIPPALPEASYVIGSWGTAAFNLRLRNCATAAGVEISKATRVLSQRESIESSKSGRQPVAGSICRYETPSELGSISVIFPDRRGPLASRAEPAKCGAHGPTASAVSSTDGRVWISGGTGAVCVGPGLLVWVSVQMAHQPRATDAATRVAGAILRRLPS